MALFSVVTNFQSTLAQGMTSSQSSMVLSSVTVQGHTLAPADYGSILYITINPGASNMEVVRASTNSGTTFTLDKRGLLWYGDNDTESSTYKYAHNAGEPVIISNVKNIYDKFVDIFSDETIGGVKSFTSSPIVPTPTAGETNAAASVEFVNNTAFAGAPDASTTVKGIVEIGTQTEVNTGDDSGTTTAPLVVIPSTHLQTMDMVVTTDYTYGDTIAVGDVLYLDLATAKWELADASAESTTEGTLGIALDAGVDTDTGKRVQIGGVVTGLTGLTAGWMYVSDTAGDLSTTPGTYKKAVGYAPNTTTLIMVTFPSADELTGGSSSLTVANLNAVINYYLNLPTANTWTAGENLAQNDIVKIQDYDGDEKLYKLQGTVAKQTIPQALADGATAVFLDDTTVLIAESNTSDTGLDVRAYTINATTGALTLITSLTVGSFFGANADVLVKSTRESATKAIFYGSGSTGSCRMVAVQLSGGVLTNGTVINATAAGSVLGVWTVASNMIVAFSKTAASDNVVANSFSLSTLTLSSVETVNIASIGNSGSPSGAWATQIDENTYAISAANSGTDLNYVVVTVDGAGDVTAGSVQAIAVDKEAIVAGYVANGVKYFVMLIDDTEFRRFSVSGTTATLERTVTTGLSISLTTDLVYAFQKSAFVCLAGASYVLDLDELTTRQLPSAFIEVGTSGRGFVPSTAKGRYLLFSLDDELQIGSFDWGEADGIVAEVVLADATTSLLRLSYESIDTLTGLTRGRQYNLTQGGTASSSSTNSALPIYKAVDETTAIISDVL